MKLAVLVMVALLVSCGQKTSSPNHETHHEPSTCGAEESKSINCLPIYKWNIELPAVDLPGNYSIVINDATAALNCQGVTDIKTTTSATGRTVLSFDHYMWPKTFFKVEIRNVNDVCDNDASFMLVEHPAYSTSTITENYREWKSVYVILDN